MIDCNTLPTPLPHLIADPAERGEAYAYLDELVQRRSGCDRLRIRQIAGEGPMLQLADARLRLYSQRKLYYQSLFGDGKGSDDIDGRSYLFATYLDDEIVATQRVTPFPFEANRYVDDASLRRFIGDDYARHYVEFSRLIVDKTCPVRGVMEAMISTAGVLVALHTRYKHCVTVVKPRLQSRYTDFSLAEDMIVFKIPERGDHDYALFKATLADSMRNFYRLDCPPEAIANLDDMRRHLTVNAATEAA
ncbi:hypothetical protein [Chromobacterium amazonense]|uniref:GNAT family N-acetyltransferase n=1 Tax=Chromobacterium amazonense TaxID=1382803 RepID=A0ABU8UZJ3_9NEIS|nr:hypothetical protein [Chromobacterium amazonense]MDQ4540372.1 hypothetical protein [Chromobacterium amazonense]